MNRVFLSPPDMTAAERNLLLDAFDSNWIAPLGAHVDAFEREMCAYVGTTDAVALSSGTAALHLALLIVGVGPGDEVLVSTLTFAATANAVRYVGAVPVFIDSNRATWNMDPDLLREALEAKRRAGRMPKAVICVDLYGQCADYEPICDACAEYGVPLIEDAAEALGASYQGRKAGTLGALGVFSFNGNKIMTCGGGGMLVSENSQWTARARFLATQARDPAPHYEHSHVGYNYRLSNLLAAVGRGQLQRLDAMIARRLANFDFYKKHLGRLPGFELMPEGAGSTSTRWLSTAVIDPSVFGASRDAVLAALAAADIEARPVWKPMHLQPVFAGLEAYGGAVAEHFFAHGICLPSGSGLSVSDRHRIVEHVAGLTPEGTQSVE